MSKNKENNFAFIDSQNLYKGIKSLGWRLDWFRFRIYLKEKYNISTAYIFIGFIPEFNDIYDELQKAGFILKFKPVLLDGDKKPKGNCDADLVLEASFSYSQYDKAVIVSSDGDFYSLVRKLYDNNKLKVVLSPHKKNCSVLLKKTAKEKIYYMDKLKNKIGKNKKESTSQGQNH